MLYSCDARADCIRKQAQALLQCMRHLNVCMALQREGGGCTAQNQDNTFEQVRTERIQPEKHSG